MAESSAGDKTEKATPRRREQARKKGQVARSQEVSSAFVLVAGISLLLVTSAFMAEQLSENTRYLLGNCAFLRADNAFGLVEIIGELINAVLKTLAPMLVAILIFGVIANVMQVGFHVSTEAMSFKTEKLNPLQGMKRMVSKKAAFELLKNVLKIGLLTLIAWWTISSLLGELTAASLFSLDGVLATGRGAFIKLAYRLLFLLAVLAVMDWSFQKYRHEEEIKMTKQEVKQEMKDIEGDPQVKARIRGIQFENLRRRMMAEVPQADVVITNPTHFAVALKYERGSQAPIVTAKGRDEIAQKIKAIARTSRVPVIENKPLARSLFKKVEIGQAVPESLYQAVAEILAYVYRLRKA